MTTAQEFAQHLATVTGSSVTTSKLPAKPESSDDQWAVIGDGGQPETGGNVLLWKKVVNLRVTYRHKKTSEVYDRDAVLTNAVASFVPLQSTSVLLRSLSPLADTDTDLEGRHTASWQLQFTITTK